MEKLNPSSLGCEKDCLPIVKKIFLVVRWVASLRWNMKLILELSRVVVWGATRWTMSKPDKLLWFWNTPNDVWEFSIEHLSGQPPRDIQAAPDPESVSKNYFLVGDILHFLAFSLAFFSSRSQQNSIPAFFHFLSLGSRTLTPTGESISISVWYLNNKKSFMFRNANQYWISVFFAFQVRDIEDIA